MSVSFKNIFKIEKYMFMVIFAVGCKSGESQIWLMHDCVEVAGLVHIEERGYGIYAFALWFFV